MLRRMIGCTVVSAGLGLSGPTTLVHPQSHTQRDEPLTAQTRSPVLDRGASGSPRSARLRTGTFTLLAVTWRGRPDREFGVRTHTRAGSWTDWRTLAPLQDT